MKPPADNPFIHPQQPSFVPTAELSVRQAEGEAAQLREAVSYHDYRYYAIDDPVIADGTYDLLFRRLQELEASFPQLRSPDSPTQRIGALPREELAEVDHLAPMLSLESSHEEMKIREFDERLRRNLGIEQLTYVAEPKFDGLSVEVVYRQGRLERGATRGDGYRGEDVTDNLRTIPSLPLRLLNTPPALIAVRGEVYIPLEGFHRLNRQRLEEGEDPFANPRNAAAGAIRMLDPSITASRPLDVFFYDILAVEWGPARASTSTPPDSHLQELERLRGLGFKVNGRSRRCQGIDEVIDYHQRLERERDDLSYEIDGVVIKVDGLEQQRTLGMRSRSPRWAFAYKFAPRLEVTAVKDIVLQVGRTGILAPVALLAPVEVGGVTISRASLHNYDQVREKDIRPGDQVRVARAGDVIPYVVERVESEVDAKRPSPFEMPGRCPVCGSEVARDGAYFVCTGGLSCPAQLLGSVQHYASRHALDIEGLGEKTVQQLIDRGLIGKSLPDLYRLRVEDLLPLDLFGEKKAQKLVAAIEKSKETTLGRFIYALGIRHIGEHTADVLAAELGDIEVLMEADEETLTGIREVGPEVAGSVRKFFAQSRNRDVVQALLESGVRPHVAQRQRLFEGQRFVITGSLEHWSRPELADLLEGLGARMTSSVSHQTDYVVVGKKPGSKASRAEELGVRTIDEAELIELLRQHGATVEC
ncbi:MAG: NAD-dependent DNA ligase LigA [Acidobacteriota bacterium]